MHKPAATLYCPNFTCQSPNPETQKFCQKCGTPLPKRYLWAVGGARRTSFQPGEILADRYAVKQDRILLDTKPGVLPEMPLEIPDTILPYLRLFPHRLHVPQVYGRLPRQTTSSDRDIWLLEEAPIYPQGMVLPAPKGQPPQTLNAQLMPSLTASWPEASPMRQLHWLWQIAKLWQPFVKEGVAGSLLNPECLRVEGSILRVLELQPSPTSRTLSQLGQLWSKWAATATPATQPYLEQLCQMLAEGQIQTAAQLLALLDRALTLCGGLHKRTYHIATGTDQGPTRRRNEDACYPPNGSMTAASPGADALAIVCDGIGGHEGGNVASNLAIASVEQHLAPLLGQNTAIDAHSLSVEIETATAIANDRIASRNDEEQRQARQRMGTTLVMALAHRHEMYVNHVGDSRAYWITRTGCRQITLDDDVASREVRLGYALYRDALQQGASGSLIQALGMSSSSLLHPTVQRFIVDEDSVFLLCSDGLSDNDRVEQYWETEILPILTGELKLPRSVTKLIDIGNFHNGHDNVTVAVVYCQVQPVKSAGIDPGALVAQLRELPPAELLEEQSHSGFEEEDTQSLRVSDAPTKLLPSRSPSSRALPILLSVAILLGVGALALRLLGTDSWNAIVSAVNDSNSNPNPTEPSPIPTDLSLTEVASVEPGNYIQLRSSIAATAGNERNLVLLKQQGEAKGANAIGIVPAGSVMQVGGKQPIEEEGDVWVQLYVCWTPGNVEATSGVREPASRETPEAQPSAIGASPSPQPSPTPTSTPAPPLKLVSPGSKGWIRESVLLPEVLANANLTPEQTENCIDDPKAPSVTDE